MIRNLLRGILVVVLGLAGLAAALYVTNAPPAVPTLSAADIADSEKPYIVKLHAQWCPYCMLTKDEWTQLQQAYRDRARMVVMDFTNEAATERSRVEAQRLGLGQFFADYAGATGVVVVLDGRTREVLAEIGGNADFSEYENAVAGALASR